MGSSIISFFLTFNTLLVSAASQSPPAQLVDAKNFSSCLARFHVSSSDIYSPTINKTSFTSILSSTAQNLRCLNESIPKPVLILRPINEHQVPPVVQCARMYNLNIRTRSGGHDYEGLSYTSFIKNQPFMILDLFNLRHVSIDLPNLTAWVQSGATLGELYYKISLASQNLAFPAGLHTSLGLGGHLPGGAYGSMLREHGLGADNVIDVRMVDASCNVRSRVVGNMDDDLFWALRGGGGANFGIILAFQIRLVSIPSKVTVFRVVTTPEQNGTAILNRWQNVAPKIDSKLFIRVIIQNNTAPDSLDIVYQALYLGSMGHLIRLMQDEFEELGVSTEQCTEMSWIESVMVISGFNITEANTPEYLLQGKPAFSLGYFKAKSDFVYEPMPITAIQGMLGVFMENKDSPLITFVPYGGMMGRIAVDATPYPHRGAMYNIQYVARWYDDSVESQIRNEDWVRRLYGYMEEFVSREPREAYVNYRDVDIGKIEGSNCSYPEIWGPKYFKGNLERLVEVKKRVDPDNFFENEQSIPTELIRDQCTEVI